jgi:hypothetical protein
MIAKGADHWNSGLLSACFGGHRDLVDLMIQKGADDMNDDLYGACLKEHRELVKLMIDKGATQCGFWHDSIAEHLSYKDRSFERSRTGFVLRTKCHSRSSKVIQG